jgi:uncharacterized ParB-like nuclease family protein
MGMAAHFGRPPGKRRSVLVQAGVVKGAGLMRLEWHQLDRRLEHLRVQRPERYRRLLGSLAASGQQTPIVVVSAEQPDHYVVIDGYQRVTALKQLGRDTVEAVVWSMSEAEALLLDHGPTQPATGDGTGRRLVAGGTGRALWIWAGRVGATFRSQRELGVAADGIG